MNVSDELPAPAKNGLVAGAGGVKVEPAMKMLPTKEKVSGFTMVELLVVIFVIAVVAALLLPALNGSDHHPKRATCFANLRQLNVGFAVFVGDHAGKFPAQVSVQDGGSMEFIYTEHVFPHFEKVNYNPNDPGFFKVLACPGDITRKAATNTEAMSDMNISYFINADSSTKSSPALNLLAGDRDLTLNLQPIKPGSFQITTNLNVNWSTVVIHKAGGNLAYADGHVLWNKAGQFNSIIQQQPLATNRLCIP